MNKVIVNEVRIIFASLIAESGEMAAVVHHHETLTAALASLFMT